LLAAGGPGSTRCAELQARTRLHDTILCRNRLRRLAGFCRDGLLEMLLPNDALIRR